MCEQLLVLDVHEGCTPRFLCTNVAGPVAVAVKSIRSSKGVGWKA